MADSTDNLIKKLRPRKIILPILIGFAVVFFLMYREFDVKALAAVEFIYSSVFWILMAFVMMALRDIFYMIRLRVLTENKLDWRQSFRVIMLWEFASAITPAAVGGTSVSVLFVHKEGISLGHSTAVVLAVSILDELYFLIMFPLLLLFLGGVDLFVPGSQTMPIDAALFPNKYFYFALVGYCLKFVFGTLVFYGLLFNPKLLKGIITFIFRLPFLKKWKKRAAETGDELIASSKELKTKSVSFWAKAFFASFLSWSARYLVLNCLLLALLCGSSHATPFNLYDLGQQFIIFARQLMMWIMLLVMPSPGGSGFAEVVFASYLKEFIPFGLVAIMAFMWRLVSYYPYLIIGVIVFPRWIKSKFMRRQSI